MVQAQQNEGVLRRLIYRWFVQYNPLYFFSALCVLAGVLLVSQALPVEGVQRDRLALAGVVQLYEFLLIGSAAFLFRVTGLRRPAVILAIVELPFLFDWTFQTEAFATLGQAGLLAASVWAALVPLKLALLAWIFRIRAYAMAYVLPTMAAIGIAGVPQALALAPLEGGLVHLGATWFGVMIVAMARRMRPGVASREDLDDWGSTVLRRFTRSAAGVWCGLSLLHLLAWVLQYDLALTIPHAAPLLLLLPFLHRHESLAWAGAAAAIGISVFVPGTVALSSAAAALVLAWHAHDWGIRRLGVGAVLSVYLAVWSFGWTGWPLPEPFLELNLATAAVCLAMAWKLRVKTAIPAAALVLLPSGGSVTPHTTLEWGIAVLALGFAALVMGVAISWRLRPSPDGLLTRDARR